MRVRTRLGPACALFVAVLAATVPAAHGKPAPFEPTGSMVEIDRVEGTIYDVDATRILYRKNEDAFAIKDRATGDVTTLPAPAHPVNPGPPIDSSPLSGFLTSHGALLVTDQQYWENLDEWRDGSFVDLGPIYVRVRAAGRYAAWRISGHLMRRDLDTGTTAELANDADLELDVAPNGDVAYLSYGYEIRRYREASASLETLATPGSESLPDDPVTDGTNVVWNEQKNCCIDAPSAFLRGYGVSGAFELDDADYDYYPSSGEDYRVAGGRIALRRQDAITGSLNQIWRRDVGGTEESVSDLGQNRLVGLADDGDVLYATRHLNQQDGLFLARPGEELVPVALIGENEGDGRRGHGDYFFKSGDHWYGAIGGSLRRLDTDRSTDTGTTFIDSAPTGDDNPSHATLEFHTEAAGALLCRLDDAPYEECESPVNLTGLQNGVRTFSVKAAGEIEPATVQWGVETTPPAVTLVKPEKWTRDRTPTFGGAAGTAEEDTDQVTLRLYESSIGSGYGAGTVTVTQTGGTWSATAPYPLLDGAYAAQAEQSDAAGNKGFSEAHTFIVDATAPVARYRVSPEPVLTGHVITFDARDSHDSGSLIVRYEWDLDGDGDFERDTGASPIVKTTYSQPRERKVAVRATDRAGNRDVSRREVTVAPEPPPGIPGVTINHGDRFTNDPSVVLSPVWPAGRTQLIVSNDGGFGNFVTLLLKRDLPWRLDSSGPERLPKTIYARFDRNGITYQDDIILDETPPKVLDAEITGVDGEASAAAVRRRTYHLRLKARDATAGVSRMQVTTDRSRPGRVRRYRSRVDFSSATPRIHVRVRDRAGNWSRWKRCER